MSKRRVTFNPDSLSHLAQVSVLRNFEIAVNEEDIKNVSWRITLSKYFDKDLILEAVVRLLFRHPMFNYNMMSEYNAHTLFYKLSEDLYPICNIEPDNLPKLKILHVFNKHESEVNKNKLYCYEQL